MTNHPTVARVAELGALIGDPARGAMLLALMDGRALTAGELAAVAGIAPATASGHLARLTEGGLLTMERQGRHRYHRLASTSVAALLEGMLGLAAVAAPAPRTGPRDAALRRVRTCYDHLAGRIAVRMATRMEERGQVELGAEGALVTPAGLAFLHELGVAVEPRGARTFCRACLDWSERRPHLGGTIGAALRDTCFARGWMRSVVGSRAVGVTPAGRRALDSAFTLSAADWD